MSNRWQRTKINTSFSTWTELLLGVPQGSVCPILFNIYLNDLFWFNEETNVCNYADDTTIYTCYMSLKTVINRLEHDSLLASWMVWMQPLKLNEDDKCNLLVAGHKYEHIWANVGKATADNEKVSWPGNEVDKLHERSLRILFIKTIYPLLKNFY